MATQVQLRRGNTSQTNAFTGAVAEITVDTDKETVVVHDGSTAGGFPLARESALSANLAFTQAAFNLANTANVTAEAGFAKANSSNVLAQAAFNQANTANVTAEAGFAQANAANVLAQAAFDKANVANTIADSGYNFANTVNIKVDAAFSFANTVNITAEAAFSKANIANTIADAAFNQANTANVTAEAAFSKANVANIIADSSYAFANSVNIKTDAAFSFANTVNIKTDAAFVQANAANVLAQAAFDKANQTAQLAFTTVSANGISAVADANNDTLTLTPANGIGIFADAATDTITINLNPTGVTSGTYGGATQIPTFVVDEQGRLTSAANVSISTNLNIAADTGSNSVALAADTLTFVGGDGITTSITPSDNVKIDVDNTVIRTTGGQTISGNLTVSGNLVITGNTITLDTETLRVNDSIILLAANNNTGDTIDIGIAAHYGVGGNNHTGFVRHAADGRWYLFENYTEHFIHDFNTINISDPTFVTANLVANLRGGKVTDLTQAIAIADGGTNATSFNTGNLIFFNGTSLVSIANTGTAGTYANATHVPVITTDDYGRVSGVTNTAIAFPVTSVAGATGAVSNTELINGIIAVDGTGSGLDADLLDGLQGTSYANATFAQAAFDQANTANITADAGFAFANTVNITAEAAFTKANDANVLAESAFTKANAANVLAQAAFDQANTDFTNISVTPGTYGNASAIPSITVDANGRISAITTESFTAASIGDALALAIALG